MRKYNIDMKVFWTILALTGFISVSFFGFILIHHQGNHIAECLASRLNGSEAPCPEADPFGFASFHSNALKKISNLIVINGSAALYLATFYIFLMFGLISLSDLSKLSLGRIRFSKSELLTVYYKQQAIRLAWFSLHENSPSYL